MPSFVCDKCQETIKKPKLDQHVQRCRGASFSCIDCYVSFKGTDYQKHFSCITEVQKYEKKPTQTAQRKVISGVAAEPVTKKIEPIESWHCALTRPMSLKDLKKALKSSKDKKILKKYLKEQLILEMRGGKVVARLSSE